MYRIVHIVHMHANERPHMTGWSYIPHKCDKVCNNNHIQLLTNVFSESNMWKTHTQSKQQFTKKKKHTHTQIMQTNWTFRKLNIKYRCWLLI